MVDQQKHTTAITVTLNDFVRECMRHALREAKTTDDELRTYQGMFPHQYVFNNESTRNALDAFLRSLVECVHAGAVMPAVSINAVVMLPDDEVLPPEKGTFIAPNDMLPVTDTVAALRSIGLHVKNKSEGLTLWDRLKTTATKVATAIREM